MIVILTQCFPPDKGGIEGLMGALADALVATELPVHVLADLIRGGDAAPAFAYPVQRFSGPRPWRRWRKMRALKQLSGVRVIIADSWKSVEALPLPQVPLLVLAHGMEFPARATDAKRARIRAALAKATAVIANSAYTAALAAPYMSDVQRLSVIHPPITPQPVATDAALAALDAVIAGRGPVLTTLSRLEPRKGIDQVIRAMVAVRQVHPQAVYLVGGAGADLPRLQALAAELGVADAVQFLGKIDEAGKAALFTRADLFAMPTRREGNSVEGFGIVYIEAAWYGVAAIAGRDGGAVDAVVDGVTGLTVEGVDAGAVEQAILTLLGDATLRERLGAAAQTRAHSELQWGAAVVRYRALMGV